VLASARAVAQRFPLVLACACTAAFASLLWVDAHDHPLWSRLALVATLGLSLCTAFALAAEKGGWSRRAAWLAQLACIDLLAVLLFAWEAWTDPVRERRYAQYHLGFHLLVACLPYVAGAELNAFWQYNRALFLRFLTSALFSLVLFTGLSIAILAVDRLFGVRIDGDNYLRLSILVGYVFNTTYFLGGIPPRLADLAHDSTYPRSLKVFSQYILLPIVTVYLVILTLYMGKVAITRVWPSGWIGYLVTSVAAAGILSLLLLHPIQERDENRWVKTYARWFYIVLLPSIGMLGLAIWKRIHQYGVTENRYFLVVLALWLAGVAVYFVVTRSRNIRVIPISLCALALGTSLGPWGAYAVSERSQRARLTRLFAASGMLRDGRVQAPADNLGFTTRREISSIVAYLISTHGGSSIADWFGGASALAAIDTIGPAEHVHARANADDRATLVLRHLGIEYVHAWAAPASDDFHFSSAAEPALIRGYDWAVRAEQPAAGFDLQGGRWEFRFDAEADALRLWRLDGGERAVLDLPLDGLRQRIASERQGARRELAPAVRIEAANAQARVLAVVQWVSGEYTASGVDISQLTCNYFVSLPDSAGAAASP
jgi:hypothetical protein